MSVLYRKNAPEKQVLESPDAIDFHASRYEGGQRDKLAKICYQIKMLQKDKK